MIKKPGIFESIKLYLKKSKQRVWQDAITGVTISALLIHSFHLWEFWHEGKAVFFVLTLFVGLVPIGVDFLFYTLRKKHISNQKLGHLYDLIEEVDQISGNILMKNSALSRIEKEIDIISNMKKNTLVLPALQNFEYIREVLRRILQNVMEPGDRYITLSKLEFWTTGPVELPSFIQINKKAVQNSNRLIDRIIVMKKDLLPPAPIKPEDCTSEQKPLVELVKNFVALRTPEQKETYFSNMKTLFYFTDNYKNFEKFLLSAIIIKANYRDIMFVQVTDLENIEQKNPKINVKYYQLDEWNLSTEEKGDTVRLLKSLFNTIQELLAKANNQEMAGFFEYLRIYQDCFSKLSTIYDINNGLQLSTLDLAKCELFDVEMIAPRFGIKV